LRIDATLGESIAKKYGNSALIALSQLTPTELDFLCASKDSETLKYNGVSINLSHGSPWKIDEYLYPDSEKSKWLEFLNYKEQVFIVGNTHHQLIKRFHGKLIINPGSIGQSRSDPGMAQWAEFDTENLAVTFKSVPYDISSVLSSCKEIDPDNYSLQKALYP